MTFHVDEPENVERSSYRKNVDDEAKSGCKKLMKEQWASLSMDYDKRLCPKCLTLTFANFIFPFIGHGKPYKVSYWNVYSASTFLHM